LRRGRARQGATEECGDVSDDRGTVTRDAESCNPAPPPPLIRSYAHTVTRYWAAGGIFGISKYTRPKGGITSGTHCRRCPTTLPEASSASASNWTLFAGSPSALST